MPFGWFLLARFFLRLDNVLFRLRETRLYHEFDQNYILKEQRYAESDYQSLKKVVLLRSLA